MKSGNISVIILAGGSLEDKALGPAKPLYNHPLLLSSGSELAIFYICNFYSRFVPKANIHIIIDQDMPIEFPINLDQEIKIKRVPKQSTVMGTLKKGIDFIQTPWVLINPITTLPTHKVDIESQILIGEQRLMQEDWSGVRRDEKNRWTFHKKQSTHKNIFSYPFTGIFTSETHELKKILGKIDENQSDDLVVVAKSMVEKNNSNVVKTEWLDLGHRATYAASRRHKLTSRAFNKLIYCSKKDIIIKRSSNKSRLKGEYNYIMNLPKHVQRYFPTLIISEKKSKDELVMEAVPFPTLAELYLHWNLVTNAWSNIFRRIKNIKDDISSSSLPIRGNSDWLYSKKLQYRWNEFIHKSKNTLLGDDWYKKEQCINGKLYKSLEKNVESLIEILPKYENDSRLELIHGDLCFNNILCEPLHNSIRLIDPRGEKNTDTNLPVGYGDSRYDLAKLFHSIAGNYDAIVNNLYQLKLENSSSIDLEIYEPKLKMYLVDTFNKLIKPIDVDEKDVDTNIKNLF